MSLITTMPQRVASITLRPELLQRLPSGRVRACVAPIEPGALQNLKKDDLIYIKEPVIFLDRALRGQWVNYRFSGDRIARTVQWPRGLPQPFSGSIPASAMPTFLSRFTLRVNSLQRCRLLSIGDDDAVACGAQPSANGGFVCPLANPELFSPFETGAEALAHMWRELHGHGAGSENPELLLINFTAFSRNLLDMVPGFGPGKRAT